MAPPRPAIRRTRAARPAGRERHDDGPKLRRSGRPSGEIASRSNEGKGRRLMWSDTVRRFAVPSTVLLLVAVAEPGSGTRSGQARAQPGEGPGAPSRTQSAPAERRDEDRTAIRAA